MFERSQLGRNLSPLSLAAEMVRERRSFAIAVVIEALGSTSAQPGSKAIFDVEGNQLAGWVGGGCAESTVAHAAVECLETGRTQIVDVNLDDEVLGAGMPCGGRMRVYVEPVVPDPVLWILGHGRVAESLCRLGAEMGLSVVVNDPSAPSERFPEARQVVSDDSVYSSLAPASGDFVVIATQHRGDHQSLRRVLATDVGYIALIASKKRAGLVFDHLREAGFDQTAIDRVRSPCGLQIHARTPEEIALSVVSEIVLVRRSGSSQPAAQAGRTPAALSLVG
jgi:xanthine dehydrogenase accessory factor